MSFSSAPLGQEPQRHRHAASKRLVEPLVPVFPPRRQKVRH